MSTQHTNPNRVPAGVKTGGQFSTGSKAEPAVSLDGTTPSPLSDELGPGESVTLTDYEHGDPSAGDITITLDPNDSKNIAGFTAVTVPEPQPSIGDEAAFDRADTEQYLRDAYGASTVNSDDGELTVQLPFTLPASTSSDELLERVHSDTKVDNLTQAVNDGSFEDGLREYIAKGNSLAPATAHVSPVGDRPATGQLEDPDDPASLTCACGNNPSSTGFGYATPQGQAMTPYDEEPGSDYIAPNDPGNRMALCHDCGAMYSDKSLDRGDATIHSYADLHAPLTRIGIWKLNNGDNEFPSKPEGQPKTFAVRVRGRVVAKGLEQSEAYRRADAEQEMRPDVSVTVRPE